MAIGVLDNGGSGGPTAEGERSRSIEIRPVEHAASGAPWGAFVVQSGYAQYCTVLYCTGTVPVPVCPVCFLPVKYGTRVQRTGTVPVLMDGAVSVM